jgi:hypothetical protein
MHDFTRPVRIRLRRWLIAALLDQFDRRFKIKEAPDSFFRRLLPQMNPKIIEKYFFFGKIRRSDIRSPFCSPFDSPVYGDRLSVHFGIACPGQYSGMGFIWNHADNLIPHDAALTLALSRDDPHPGLRPPLSSASRRIWRGDGGEEQTGDGRPAACGAGVRALLYRHDPAAGVMLVSGIKRSASR